MEGACIFPRTALGGVGDYDIWVVRWNGTGWDSLTCIGQNVNTPYHEGWPSETADGRQLYFGSWDHDLYGWGDLWMSAWTGSEWGQAVNLGSPINTELTACSPFVTWDMRHFYCGSEANEGGHGEEDIWSADSVYSPDAPAEHKRSWPSPLGWEPTGDLDGAQFVYCLLEAQDHSIYAGTYPYGDVFRTTDGGDSWHNTAYLPGADRVYSLMQTDDGTIYAGTYPNGDVFKTADDGATWENTSDLPGATSVRCLLQTSDLSIYAGTATGIDGPEGGGRLFVTTDGGAHWGLTSLVPDCESAVLALMETTNRVLFAGGLHSQVISWSTDGGRTGLRAR